MKILSLSAALSVGALASLLAPRADARHSHAYRRVGPQPFGPAAGAAFHSTSKLLGKDLPFSPSFRAAAAGAAASDVYSKSVPSFKTGAASFPTIFSVDPIVAEFMNVHLGFSEKDYMIRNAYTSDHNRVTHVYLSQLVNGLPVANADININIDDQGRIFSYGDSFHKGKKPIDSSAVKGEERQRQEYAAPTFFSLVSSTVQRVFNPLSPFSFSGSEDRSESDLLSPKEAFLALTYHLSTEVSDPSSIELVYRPSLDSDEPRPILINVPFALNREVSTRLGYIQTEDGDLEMVHDFELEMENNWYSAHVSARTGKVLSLVDWTADASYTVFPLGYNDPRDGPRVTVVDPADEKASPFGWNSQGFDKNFTVTIGNNVFAHENLDGSYGWENNHRPDGGKGLIFNSTLDLNKDPKEYIDAAITNLFYWNNIIHDLFHRYGFDEKSGNFQENNLGRGGKGGDAIIANAQDGSGYNNANFATPPDGQRGKMRMYVWNVVTPYHDGDLESGIIIHEYAHGISTRLTGGPANSNCLGWGEAGGMGEGWGDFFATILRMKPETTRDQDWVMGDYSNGGQGIRRYPYSTSKKTNPETFAVMDKPGYWGVHAKGAVWAQMLFEVYWNLVEKHGFNDDWYSTSTKHGNTLALQLVVDGMKLQPCRPSFVQARDAILQADEVLTGGDNACEIWKGFSKRGLGEGAKLEGSTPWGGGVRKESFKLPRACKE